MQDVESDFTHKPEKLEELKITIVGLGLMGGSLSLAIKKFLPRIEITGVDKDKAALKKAKERGAIDIGARNLKEGVKEAELIFLACPIGEILDIIPKLPPLIGEKTIVSDMGSTKSQICKKAECYFPQGEDFYFIGGHPMTGGATKGIEEANPLMFENAIYILTPVGEREKQVSDRKVKPFLEKLGAEIAYINPDKHDLTAAYVSHLPQLIAVSLAGVAGRREDIAHICAYLAAGGFKDMTRIASSPFGMWKDIFKTNRKKISQSLQDFIELLKFTEKKLTGDELEDLFIKSARFRESIPNRQKGLTLSLHRISVFLPDRPGSLAELTGTLFENGLNIKDIELLRVRENFEGIFQIYFDSPQEAKKAANVLTQAGFKSRVRE